MSERKGYMAVVGAFDGVHTGHQYLLGCLDLAARRSGLLPLVLTFATHPSALLSPPGVPLLMPDAERLARLAGEDRHVAVLDFDAVLQAMTAADFVRHIHDRYDVRHLLMGWDTRFGSDMPGDAAVYDALCAGAGVDVSHEVQWGCASSRLVRQRLGEGRVDLAADLLGRPYSLAGTVTEGRRLGRTIGVPTANLSLDEPRQLLPLEGTYVSDAIVDDVRRRAVTNIGRRPTVDGDGAVSIETHIIDYDGDLYGKPLRVELLGRLRTERRFGSLDALKAQIDCDIKAARVWKS